jgi:hypothetical protein
VRQVVREAEIFARSDWQMTLGERAALDGVLAELSPRLAIEVGTAEGGSLARIAVHSAEVHAIDLTRERLAACPPNAHFHQGDSREVLPALLESPAVQRTVILVHDSFNPEVRSGIESAGAAELAPHHPCGASRLG